MLGIRNIAKYLLGEVANKYELLKTVSKIKKAIRFVEWLPFIQKNTL